MQGYSSNAYKFLNFLMQLETMHFSIRAKVTDLNLVFKVTYISNVFIYVSLVIRAQNSRGGVQAAYPRHR